MVSKIEMSLDDIIKSNRSTKRGGGPGGRRPAVGARGGAARKGGRRGVTTGSPRKPTAGIIKGRSRGAVQKSKFVRGDVNSAWKHDMYDGPKRAGILKVAGDLAKLIVGNLDYGVSDSDIHELFNEFGPLKKAAVHYDRSGRSLGVADVIFERRSDALKAMKQYNGVPLDGRPMNIQMASSDIVKAGRLGTRKVPTPAPRGSRAGASAGGGRRNFPNRKGEASAPRAARGKVTSPTAEELDAELDAYVNDMKI